MAENWTSGKDGKVTAAGTDLRITAWTYEETGDDADTTHSGSGGVKTSLAVNTQYAGTVEANWDSDLPVTSNPPQLNRGDVVSLDLYLNREANIAFSAVEITGLSINNTVTGIAAYSFSWQGQVAPTYPGPTAYSSSSSSSSSSDSSSGSSSSSSSST